MKLFLSFLIIFLSLDPAAFADGGGESKANVGGESKVNGGGDTKVDGGGDSKIDGGSSSRIYGGYKIDITAAPWMAYIQYNKKSSYSFCGGTIVNQMFILTAAHCAYTEVRGGLRKNNASQYVVRIGSSNRSQGGSVYKVAKVIPHPSYEPVDMPHDVALLKLTKKITYNKRTVKNVHLDRNNGAYKAGEKVSSMGWGENPENPKTLNIYKVSLKIVDTAQCARSYRDSATGYKKHKICALGPKPKNGDVCEGDSGGPLLHGNQQIGVVSYGGDCPQKNGERSPGVYAKIADNLAWIKKVISGSKEQDDDEDSDEDKVEDEDNDEDKHKDEEDKDEDKAKDEDKDKDEENC
ncbi:trypsin 3A1-like [Bradysia coprophila]|uniref:trypsin 3A1-like n=1 Tax=Bradysia coprophila TaxID=38358 RepID=UPI00187DB6A3|nr:trypsin 3A1-like [Bradysia coprophila]